jgi:hypothetical protein
VRGRAETVNPEALAVASFLEGSPTDETCAKQRRQRHRVFLSVEVEGKTRVGEGMAGEARRRAYSP